MSAQMTCVLVFPEALFRRAPNCEQLKCASAGKWIQNVLYQYNETLLAIKRNEVLIDFLT